MYLIKAMRMENLISQIYKQLNLTNYKHSHQEYIRLDSILNLEFWLLNPPKIQMIINVTN